MTRCLIPLLEDDEAGARLDPRASLRELSQDLDIWIRALAVRCLIEQLPDDLGQLRGVADVDETGLVGSAVSRLEALSVRETDTLDIVDRVLALQRVSMFAEVDPEDLERIAALTSERHYDPGELIFAWGAESNEMLVIVRGEVTVSRQGEGSFRPKTLRSGEHVGELALLARPTSFGRRHRRAGRGSRADPEGCRVACHPRRAAGSGVGDASNAGGKARYRGNRMIESRQRGRRGPIAVASSCVA